jgi:hypothetical protein
MSLASAMATQRWPLASNHTELVALRLILQALSSSSAPLGAASSQMQTPSLVLPMLLAATLTLGVAPATSPPQLISQRLRWQVRSSVPAARRRRLPLLVLFSLLAVWDSLSNQTPSFCLALMLPPRKVSSFEVVVVVVLFVVFFF